MEARWVKAGKRKLLTTATERELDDHKGIKSVKLQEQVSIGKRRGAGEVLEENVPHSCLLG